MASVGIDLDGVCFDFQASFKHYLTYHLGLPSEAWPEAARWHFYRDWGLSDEEFVRHCHDAADRGYLFTHGRPIEGTEAAFQRLHEDGHTIHIITDRSWGANGCSEAQTRSWLDQYRLHFDSLTFTGDKTVVRVDYMVDDRLENFEALLDARRECRIAVEPFLMDRPWNQSERFGHRWRVASLPDYVSAINFMEGI